MIVGFATKTLLLLIAPSHLQFLPFHQQPLPLLGKLVAVVVTMPYIDDGFEALTKPFYNGKKLTDPIDTVKDKYELLPAFLKVKGV